MKWIFVVALAACGKEETPFGAALYLPSALSRAELKAVEFVISPISDLTITQDDFCNRFVHNTSFPDLPNARIYDVAYDGTNGASEKLDGLPAGKYFMLLAAYDQPLVSGKPPANAQTAKGCAENIDVVAGKYSTVAACLNFIATDGSVIAPTDAACTTRQP